jgi:hypothetical protein
MWYVLFFIVLVVALLAYVNRSRYTEGFATIALDGETMPKCLLRDADAQQLLAMFHGLKAANPASDAAMGYEEFKLILQKLLCIDADITGSGAGPYSTYQLPFATAHDIEPAASFVGRCVRNAVRERDITMAMEKFETRGIALIESMCADAEQRKAAHAKFHNIVVRVTKAITEKCLTEKAAMDHPAGPRDPGYYMPPTLEEHAEYSIFGGEKQYI